MVLLQTENIEQHKSRLTDIDIRIVHDGEIAEKDVPIRGIHLHPKDVEARFCRLTRPSTRKLVVGGPRLAVSLTKRGGHRDKCH